MTPSGTHLVLIPSYNSGPQLAQTVARALAAWQPVLVVVDGSTDGSADALVPKAGLDVLRRDGNGGKGAAVRDGLLLAAALGFTHALVMDADGQHPAEHISGFMAASLARPEAMILGQPRFGADAPWPRVWGRRVSNALTAALAGDVGDSLFGFRVYPIRPLLAAMAETTRMRRFDFDAEALVRLAWRGVPAVKRPVPVRYPRLDEGGVSHFRYGRDNLLLAGMHLRLLLARLGRSRGRP
ncbi:MAG: hypothetical protein NVSMB18_00570 [Acetobacteraceae bacterium]